MHALLESIVAELDQLVSALNASIPSDEPFGIAQGNGTFPCLSKSDLQDEADALAQLIQERGGNDLGSSEKKIGDYIRRIAFLRTTTVPQIWGSAHIAVPSYFATLDGLRRAVAPVLATDATGAEIAARSFKRVKALEARLNDFEPRSVGLADMILRIEQAHDTANQLPADIEQLTQDRAKISALIKACEADKAQLSGLLFLAEESSESLTTMEKEAGAVLTRCESAYSAATSQGLAAAFAERSTALSTSMWAWVVGLVAALAFGAIYGSQRLHELSELMKNPSLTTATVFLNLLLAALSVAAPIWFGWLATKQIGQRFRLSEDYAYKASVSRAYEGYRREAARFDDDMEARLLSSALSRLDEQPLRFVENDSHGSPWHELASSEVVKNAMKSVPGFAESITATAKEAAREALSAIKSSRSVDKSPAKQLAATDSAPTP